MRWWSRFALAGAALLGLAAPAAAVADETPSSIVACEDLLTPTFTAEVPVELPPADEPPFGVIDGADLVARGGAHCSWLSGAGGWALEIGYAPLTAAARSTLVDTLEADGLTATDTAAGIVLRPPVAENGLPADLVGSTYLLTDAHEYVVTQASFGSGGFFETFPSDDALLSLVAPVEALTADEGQDEAAPAETVDRFADPGDPGDLASSLRPAPGDPFTAADPSVVSGLSTVADVVTDPRRLATAAAIGLVLTALVALPTALLNDAVQTGYDRLQGAVRRLVRRRDTAERATTSRFSPAAGIAVGIVAAAALSTFIDPRVGLNEGSLRLFLSTLGGLLLESLALLALAAAILRRRGIHASLRFALGSLAILALAVVVTRLTGFQPGFLFGVVLVLVVAARVAGSARAPDPDAELTAARVELALLAALSLVAWLGYSALYPVAADGDVIALFLDEMLAATALGGLTALVVLLLPAGDTPGAAIFRANRLRWTAAFVTAMLAFCAIVIPMPESWSEVDAPLVVWSGFFVAYCLIAVAAWAAVTLATRRDAARTHPERHRIDPR